MDNLQLSSRHGQRPFQGAPLNPSSASVGVAGFSQVEMRGIIYNSVDFGTGKSLVSSDWRSQINGGRARILMSQKSREKGGGGGGKTVGGKVNRSRLNSTSFCANRSCACTPAIFPKEVQGSLQSSEMKLDRCERGLRCGVR